MPTQESTTYGPRPDPGPLQIVVTELPA